MRRNLTLIASSLIAICFVSSCGLFSGSKDAELIFPATEVGEPVGDMITKDIGPAGGTLTSPDGRITLTVPPNALSETISFSIQPITNKAQEGGRLAYRFGPDGKTFTVPLEMTFKYDEKDLTGTMAEALLVAFQDQTGGMAATQTKKI